MYVKEIKFKDLDGVEKTMTAHFHYSKSELYEMQHSVNGGLYSRLRNIIEAQNAPEIVKHFKDIILGSYGKKSDDGSRFIKSPELSESFYQTEAYSVLFMELVTDAKAAAEFVNGIIPTDVAKQLAENTEYESSLIPGA